MSQPTKKANLRERSSPRASATRDNRRHGRFVVSLPVHCTRVAGRKPTPLRGRTADVSGGGLAVELPTRLPPGTRLAIEIRTGIGPLRMEMDVLWTRRVGGQEGVTRHGLCLAGRTELMDLPIHVLLGQWLQGLAKRKPIRPAPASAPKGTRVRRGTRR